MVVENNQTVFCRISCQQGLDSCKTGEQIVKPGTCDKLTCKSGQGRGIGILKKQLMINDIGIIHVRILKVELFL